MKYFITVAFLLFSNFVAAENTNEQCTVHAKAQTPVVFKNVAIDVTFLTNFNNTLLEAGYIQSCYSYKTDHELNQMTFMIEDTSKVPNLGCFLHLIDATYYFRLQLKNPAFPKKDLSEFVDINYCSALAKTDDLLDQRFQYYYSLKSLTR